MTHPHSDTPPAPWSSALYEWTAEQRAALDALNAFLDGPPGLFTLAGYAGTGKTTAVVHALGGRPDLRPPRPGETIEWSQVKARGRGVCFSAPTHKAVGVLEGRGLVPGASYQTLHAMLGCRRYRKDGHTVYLPDPERSSWERYRVIVIDEVSMVGETMWGWLTDAQDSDPRHVILMGDPAQLPPVADGEGLSPAFECIDAQLTDVMRSAGVVCRASLDIRADLSARQPVEVTLGEDAEGVVEALDADAFLRAAVEDFRAGADAIVLAWTNDAVDWLNATIRRELFGADAPVTPQRGERLVVVRSHPLDGVVTLHAERTLTVELCEPVELAGIPAWRLEVKELPHNELHMVRPSGRVAYRKALDAARAKGKRQRDWSDYYRLEDTFIQLRPGYATTVHKSQGSTYDTVYVVDTNLRTCRDVETRNMLRYVAFSRASGRLVLS